MRFTRWINKATDTHSEYVMLLVLDWHFVHTNFLKNCLVGSKVHMGGREPHT